MAVGAGGSGAHSPRAAGKDAGGGGTPGGGGEDTGHARHAGAVIACAGGGGGGALLEQGWKRPRATQPTQTQPTICTIRTGLIISQRSGFWV